MKQLFSVTLLLLTVTSISYAATTLVASGEVIANFQSELIALKQKTNLPVAFPQQLPLVATKKYYLSTDIMPQGNGYFISVDYTANCHGANYCSAGAMFVRQNGKLQTNQQNKVSKVFLDKGIVGYYTPDFNAGTFVPPTLEWQTHHRLYHISWQHFAQKKVNAQQKNVDAKKILLIMANSVINQ